MRDPDAREERLPRIVVFILVSVAAFGGLLVAGVCALADRAPTQARQPSNVEAFTICKQLMQQRMRAPATSSFAAYPESTVRRESGDYVVLSHVDSQNGFGALIRTRYTCTVRPNGAERWSLVSLVTDP